MASAGFDFQAMSSSCQIRLEGRDETDLAAAAERAIKEIRRIERKYSRYRSDSIVSTINQAAGSQTPVRVDKETAGLLGFASQLYQMSDGLFDVTSGIFRNIWNFKAGKVPSQEQIDAVLPLIGWSKVNWDGERISLPLSGMEIDFGGFGKEYAADRAATIIQEAGIQHGFVNLGGDLRVIGPRSTGQGWRFGIQHPRDDGQVLVSVELAAGGLATSGDYERYFEADGRRYCHILDVRTGWPVNCWASVSVVAPACLAAGALSTIAMLKQKVARDFLEDQAASALLISPDLALQYVGSEKPFPLML
jgi:thiamine biosynthesis lipoprotein